MSKTPPTILTDIRGIRDTQEKKFIGRKSTIAIGTGRKSVLKRPTDQLCFKIYVSKKLPLSQIPKSQRIPKQFDNIPTDVEVMDTPRALSLRDRYRPIKGGYSVGHGNVTAGTIGTCVYDIDRKFGENDKYILSNNHVLANRNDAAAGDPIYQPGPADMPTGPDTHMARLTRWIDLIWTAPDGTGDANIVDAAIAEGLYDRFGSHAGMDRQIYWIGHVKGWFKWEWISPGMKVQKTGRTTEYTVGEVDSVDATVPEVTYGTKKANFEHQIIMTPGNFSKPGDSGSLVTDLREVAVGLVYAGSSTHVFANYIDHVQDLLQIVVSENAFTF